MPTRPPRIPPTWGPARLIRLEAFVTPTDLTGTAPTQVESLLLDLGTQAATGSLTLTHPDGDEAVIWFREGRIYDS